MIVMKFGGTSNQDAAAMRNVIRIVLSHRRLRPVIVISAIARATNELEQIARSSAAGREDEANGLVDRLIARHKTIADELITVAERRAKLETLLDGARRAMQRSVQGIAIVGELTPRMMDAMCSFGERLSSAIIAAGLEEQDVESVWFDAKDFMITDDHFGNAMPLMDVVMHRLAEKIAPVLVDGKIPVTQGFIGATAAGEYTTMGRESSDFSASIIGAAMNAELVQIWTDVDGILTADPTVVQNPRIVRSLSFEEAIELSRFGAKVLHPKTMLPLLERRIPLEIRNSRNCDGAGTRVQDNTDASDSTTQMKSVTYQKGLTLFTVRPLKRYDRSLFWEGIFGVLAGHGLQSGVSVTSVHALAFAVKGVKDLPGLRQQLEEFGSVETHAGKASISIVGGAIRKSPGVMSRIFRALPDIPIALITFGASDLSVSLLVEEARLAEALNLLHAELFA